MTAPGHSKTIQTKQRRNKIHGAFYPPTPWKRDSMLRGQFFCGCLFSVLCMTEFSGIWSVGDVLRERALHKPTSALKHLLKLQTRTQVARAGSRIEIFFRQSHGVEHFEHHHTSHTAKWVPVITLWSRRGCCRLETHVLEGCASICLSSSNLR